MLHSHVFWVARLDMYLFGICNNGSLMDSHINRTAILFIPIYNEFKAKIRLFLFILRLASCTTSFPEISFTCQRTQPMR